MQTGDVYKKSKCHREGSPEALHLTALGKVRAGPWIATERERPGLEEQEGAGQIVPTSGMQP